MLLGDEISEIGMGKVASEISGAGYWETRTSSHKNWYLRTGHYGLRVSLFYWIQDNISVEMYTIHEIWLWV